LKQKIKNILIPETGLNLSPESVMVSEVDTDFTRTISHIVGHGPGGPVVLLCTTDGRLNVVSAGTTYETYVVESGTAADAFTGPNTYDQALAYHVTDILVETHPALIAFRNVGGTWGDEKIVPVGFMSMDLIHYGMRIRNRNAGDNAVYEFTIYR